jgi:3-oxoadipate enol-lactonase
LPRAADGLGTAWYEVGRGAPLVLVHGLADDHRGWRKALPALAMRHRVVLYDLRGHGQTPPGEADGTLAQLVGDLVRLMDAVGLERASVAGFSLGGTIALGMAIHHPDRVDRLLPVATSSRVGRAASEWFSERAALAERGRGGAELWPVLERDTREQLEHAPAELSDHLAIRAESTRDARGYASACRAMARLREAPLDPLLGRITAPTLVLAGELDRHCPPRAAEIVAAGIPGSRLQVLAGCGHQLPVEKPAELARAMLEHLAAGR